MRPAFLQATSGSKRRYSLPQTHFNKNVAFSILHWSFEISLAQEWASVFGWSMVVPWVVPQHRFFPSVLTWMEDQKAHNEMRAKPEEICCSPMHSCKAKASIYLVLWVDASGVEECYCVSSSIIMFHSNLHTFQHWFGCKSKDTVWPCSIPKNSLQFKDPAVWPPMQSLAGTSSSRPGTGIVCLAWIAIMAWCWGC